ncbi:hypothetical protein [Streptomyces fulvoviolaceus]|nr:hypothetical protein [Streptomyces fulvoviolaceus]MCT9076088.1 hypothetical protein [Streptomyces fulvoviolaceus]
MLYLGVRTLPALRLAPITPRAARAVVGGIGGALTALGAVLLVEPLLAA